MTSEYEGVSFGVGLIQMNVSRELSPAEEALFDHSPNPERLGKDLDPKTVERLFAPLLKDLAPKK